jgi:hypothetical protein
MRISAVFTSFNYQMQGCQDNRIHITIYTVHLKNGTTLTLKPRCNVYCQYITIIIWFINLIKMRYFGDLFFFINLEDNLTTSCIRSCQVTYHFIISLLLIKQQWCSKPKYFIGLTTAWLFEEMFTLIKT